jgi:hypothetical protein
MVSGIGTGNGNGNGNGTGIVNGTGNVNGTKTVAERKLFQSLNRNRNKSSRFHTQVFLPSHHCQPSCYLRQL